MVGLGDLPGGSFSSTAFGVSADGNVVVGQGTDDGGSEAFIWTSDDGMQSLADVLISGGVDLLGFRLERAFRVSGDGQTIVGDGINPDGFREAYVATLTPPPPVPALGPIGIALLLSLLAATAYWRLRESASA